jgi:GNAT superfamily N-acetyltransferase
LIIIKLIKSTEIYSIIPLLKILNVNISEDTLKTRLDQMLNEGYQCVGAFENNNLVGICGLWILTKYYIGKHIEPDNMIIHPNYQNQNIGSKLMKWIDDFAKENACVASELNCYINNDKAHEFYKKQDYEVIALHFQKKFENV